MLQGWYDLAALHWRYAPAEVQALLPKGFVVDTFDGSAWVGLIPFHMRRIRSPWACRRWVHCRPFPKQTSGPTSSIPYGRRGVWFFSLDIPRLLPTVVARHRLPAPYCWSTMSIDGEGHGDGATRRYRSRRRRPHGEATSDVAVRSRHRLAGDATHRARSLPHRPLGARHHVRPAADVGQGQSSTVVDPCTPRCSSATNRSSRQPDFGHPEASRSRGGRLVSMYASASREPSEGERVS